ncbi:hexokinase family protein [Grosmannia clavigera kw1407]|uniref:Phosphotransferase n=1 Tax=Grosmannia clavigera (strain kw1407 / UAMH 11150) TaxID=655863 RepID=F0X8M8_GROCL|nr:hexokinase family protein [Grosmannia clavigera kw1407]EFX05612.1 hexokinase family protein [Grosmannia clavigera kw1407]
MAGSLLQNPSPSLDTFLQPLRVDGDRVFALSRGFASTFAHLAADSLDQFLSTPITESILLPPRKRQQGTYLAIDIGGTNLRVGFIELGGGQTLSHDGELASDGPSSPALRRLHERNWPIQEHLKSQNADSLFKWIGGCIAAVVRDGTASFGLPADEALPMGVTFSFPMEQESLSEAKLMAMGKGFAMTPKLDLGSHLIRGYEIAQAESAAKDSCSLVLPPITVAAITNDAVATLVSFVYEVQARRAQGNQKAAMGLICGTGSNATLLLKRSLLHPSKLPERVNGDDDMRIAVNTEWSINGSEGAMRAVGFVSRWDDQLSQTVEAPGFQPLEYMTAGRYLGELGRIMLVDYVTSVLGLPEDALPAKFLRRFDPRKTTFLSHYRPGKRQSLLAMLEAEFPVEELPSGRPPFQWTGEIAAALYHIAKAIETRAAAVIAAATIGLLDCAGELPAASSGSAPLELVVGYTGGCITNFQDYLVDCQAFLDDIVAQRYSSQLPAPPSVRVVLSPCHDGGIKGAGILVPASLASQGRVYGS